MPEYIVRVSRSLSAELQRYWVSIESAGNHESLFRSEMLLERSYAKELADRMAEDLGDAEVIVEDEDSDDD